MTPDALLGLWRAAGPVIVAVAPLAAALLIAMAASMRVAHPLAMACQAAILLMTLDIANAELLSGTSTERIAGFAAMIVASLTTLTIVSASPLLLAEDRAQTAPTALAVMVALGGLLQGLLLLSPDVWSLFAWLEAASLCAIGLAALSGRRDAHLWAMTLSALVIAGVGAVLFATGAAIGGEGYAAAFAAALMVIGVAIRTGVAPLAGGFIGMVARAGHSTALLIGPALAIAALIALARLISMIESDALRTGAQVAAGGLGALSCVIAAIQAVGAKDVRSFIANTLAAQCGMILIGLAATSQAGVAAGLAHAVTFACIATGLLFAAAAAAPNAGPTLAFSQLDGLGKRRPLASAAMAIGALSVIGAPLTAGFLSKWLLIQASLAQGWPLAAAAIVIASLLAVAPVGALIERMYFTPVDDSAPAPHLSGVALAPALALSFVLTLALGLNAADLVAWANYAGPAPGGR